MMRRSGGVLFALAAACGSALPVPAGERASTRAAQCPLGDASARPPPLPIIEAPARAPLAQVDLDSEIGRLSREARCDAKLEPSGGDSALRGMFLRQREIARANDALRLAARASTPVDHEAIARLLLAGPRLRHWAEAREHALVAARGGDPAGRRLAAEAWDRWLLHAGYAQRFGTQRECDARGCTDGNATVGEDERAQWTKPAPSPLEMAAPACDAEPWESARVPLIDAILPPIAVAPAARYAFEARAHLRHNEPRLALEAARRAWSEGARDERTALPAARAAVRLGDVGEVLAWLERAVDAGWHEARTLEVEPSFASLAPLEGFRALAARVRAQQERVTRAGNEELRRARDEDQDERLLCGADLSAWGAQQSLEHDAERRDRVAAIVAAGGARTGPDYFAAALVMQHGDVLSDWATAREWAAEAARRGERSGRLTIAAAAWDRWLVNAGYPQRFGTQSFCDPHCRVLPIDDAVSDDERVRWDIAPREFVEEE